jgi:putative ABC transport system permease protein
MAMRRALPVAVPAKASLHRSRPLPMLRLALRMLFGDTAKYLMLIVGIFFATFLMAQQAGVFCGLMLWTTSTLKNIPAPLWIVDKNVEQVNETNPLRDTDVALVRSVDSVDWAQPLFATVQRARMVDGRFKIVTLIGIDSSSLAGAPVRMREGRLEDVRLPHAVIIDDLALKRLSPDPTNPIKIGDTFEINDQEARVVGIAEAMTSFTGGPYVWTTYSRAMQYAPSQRKMLSAVIASPRPGVTPEAAAEEIEAKTGLRAWVNGPYGSSKRDFNQSTIWWYVRNTGIPISFGTTVIIGFIVGVAISCQTFYSFVLEHMKHLGALKAMGASTWTLCKMLLVQAFTVGIIGYGIGLAATSAFALGALKNEEPPFYMPDIVPPAVLGVICLICSLAALLGIWRVARLEPAMVFRG